MKKVLLMFAFIATLLAGSIGTAGAQVNYTVYDGTNTNSYVPVYGYYCDNYLKCEYVIPADHLTAINGSTISALKFYSSTASADWGSANFRVFLKEVASPTISSYSGYADATEVYMGSLSISDYEMVVNFTTNYTYNGGNLLIGFYNEAVGDWVSASFYGKSINGSCVQGYNANSLSSVTTNQRNFIPKTTFTVDELHGCLTPTNLAVSDVATYGATVTWTPGNTETAWVVKFNDDEYSVSGTPSYTVAGLTPNTSYVASVKAVCGGTEESEYTTPGVLFTTLPTCPAPTAVTVSNITTTSADIAWTNGGEETAWTIDYNGTEVSATTNPFTLTGLNAATSYTVKVKANCSEEDESDWSATTSFTTECGIFVVTASTPFTENFNTLTSGIPNCWDNAEGTTTNSSYKWSYYSTGVTGSCVRFNSYFNSNGNYNLLKTPVLDLTAVTLPVLSFTHKNPSAAGGFEVMYTTDGGATYMTIATGLQGAGAWTTEEIPVSALANNANVMFVFKGTSNYGSGDDYIYLDDVMVYETPTCPKPTAVTVSNVTAHTADIAWTNGGTETAWTIDYNGTEIAADSNPFILTGLDAATSYTVKVKAVCSEEDESDWSATASFTTECDVVVVTENNPFVEDFNTLTSGIPTCWDNAEGTTTTDSYKWNYYYAGNTGAGVRFNSYTNSNGRTNYLKTAELDLSALTTVAVNFSYKNPNGGDFSVYYTIDGTNYEEIASGLTGVSDWTDAEYIVNDLAGATNARIIFKGTSNYGSDDAYIYLDDIMVAKVPTCPKPTGVTISNVTAYTADIAWTENGTATEWTIEYNGTEITADSIPFTLTNLTNSTLYTVKVKANCSDDDESDWSTEVSFRTECGTIVVTDENPFLEGFEGPDFGCWTTEQVAGTANWELSTSYASEGNKSAKFPWTTNAEGRLISPILDLTQLTNSFVKFGHYQPVFNGAADELHLYYRASASDDWTLLQSFTTPTTGFAEEEIALPNPSATYQICFHGKGLDKLAIYVDNVFVGAYIPCLTPTAVVVSNETETSADVDWTAGNQETAWNIRYRPVSNSVFFDFEDGLQGWTTLNTDGDEYVFVHSSENIGEYDYTSFGHNGSNGFAVSNSYIDYVGEVNANQYLVAPNAITVDSVTSLNFYYDYGNDDYPDYFEAGIFTQDPTDATNFTSLWNSQDRGAANTNRSTVRHTERTRYNNWREVTIDLSEYAGQQVWIAFHHQDYDNFELWLDDITIGELPDEWTVVEGVTNPYTIEGLTANTTYEVQVQAACSEDETSDWTASVEFTTLDETPVVDTCAVPANVTVENNVATWESEAENFNLMYIVAEDTTTVEVAGNTYTVEGLENGTEVVVLVQAICDEDNTSDWSEAVTFTFETVGINGYSINAKVYPNPTTGLINVDCAAINADVTVYDMFGKLMMTSKIANERTELDFSAFAPGMYIVRIADANNSTNVKVVKK